jgi:predicted nucleic acid-binding protein
MPECADFLAKDAEADYLITGDKDLLDIKTFHGTRIIPPSDLEALDGIH